MEKYTVSTPVGAVVLIWKSGEVPRITEIILPRPGEPATVRAARLYTGVAAGACPAVAAAARDMLSLLSGGGATFDFDLLDWAGCTKFEASVLRALGRVPRGRVATYGVIAGHLGVTGGARAVGNALAGNPFPLVIPCHRVIRSDCSIGGFGGGPGMKRRLLAGEGVRFDASGRLTDVNALWTFGPRERHRVYL